MTSPLKLHIIGLRENLKGGRMGKIRVAINGFGRIGRNAFKIAQERNDIEIVAVNDLTSAEDLAYLLKYDSNYGTYAGEIKVEKNNLIINGNEIKIFKQADAKKLPWKEMGVEVVLESTGKFTTFEKAKDHLEAGAKRVVISAPSESPQIDTLMIGVNDDKIESSSLVVSNASCTANSVAAVLSILDEEIGVKKSMLTSIHSYTSDQPLQDAPSDNLRYSRAGAKNLVPTETGAISATAKAIPYFKNRLEGLAVRVPVSNVSISDLTILFERKVTVTELNDLFKKMADEPFYRGIIGVTDEPLVSTDFIGNSYSATIDLSLTKVVDGDLAKIMIWYDNEWGYSNRLVELVADIGRDLHRRG